MNDQNSEHCNDPESFTSLDIQSPTIYKHLHSIPIFQNIIYALALMIIFTYLTFANIGEAENTSSSDLCSISLIDEGFTKGC